MIEPGKVLLADDDPRDVELTLAALAEHRLTEGVVVVRDGEQALDYLYRRGEFEDRTAGNPEVVLLDLKMPKVSGIDVLRRIKTDDRLRTIPVVVLTSSREERDLRETYQLHANAYVVKPVRFQEFVDTVSRLGAFWAFANVPPPDVE